MQKYESEVAENNPQQEKTLLELKFLEDQAWSEYQGLLKIGKKDAENYVWETREALEAARDEVKRLRPRGNGVVESMMEFWLGLMWLLGGCNDVDHTS